VGKTTVDEKNILCVACKCVVILGGVCLCWVVVELLTCVWCGVVSLSFGVCLLAVLFLMWDVLLAVVLFSLFTSSCGVESLSLSHHCHYVYSLWAS
jgi:hypothetical protein